MLDSQATQNNGFLCMVLIWWLERPQIFEELVKVQPLKCWRIKVNRMMFPCVS